MSALPMGRVDLLYHTEKKSSLCPLHLSDITNEQFDIFFYVVVCVSFTSPYTTHRGKSDHPFGGIFTVSKSFKTRTKGKHFNFQIVNGVNGNVTLVQSEFDSIEVSTCVTTFTFSRI